MTTHHNMSHVTLLPLTLPGRLTDVAQLWGLKHLLRKVMTKSRPEAEGVRLLRKWKVNLEKCLEGGRWEGCLSSNPHGQHWSACVRRPAQPGGTQPGSPARGSHGAPAGAPPAPRPHHAGLCAVKQQIAESSPEVTGAPCRSETHTPQDHVFQSGYKHCRRDDPQVGG